MIRFVSRLSMTVEYSTGKEENTNVLSALYRPQMALSKNMGRQANTSLLTIELTEFSQSATHRREARSRSRSRR